MSEEVIEPSLLILDSHHHLKLNEGLRYLADELKADIASHNVRATVYVEGRSMYRQSGPQAMRPVGETEFANGVAAMAEAGFFNGCRACAAIVGFADLGEGSDVAAVLDAHIAAGGSRFRGIRQGSYYSDVEEAYRYLSLRPPPGLLLDGRFQAGYAQLAPRGLSFDAVMFHTQLPELAKLAQAFPDTQIVLNHLGFPLLMGPDANKRDQVFADWKVSMGQLAACPNVAAKVSGFGTPFWGFGFNERNARPASIELAQAWRPWVETAIELLGPGRCMFASNFPTDRASCDYPVLWNAMKRIASQYSADEKRALFSGTAAAIYRIDMPS